MDSVQKSSDYDQNVLMHTYGDSKDLHVNEKGADIHFFILGAGKILDTWNEYHVQVPCV
jgi:hypothetical protein